VANVLPPDPVPTESEWAELRESQAQALALPHTGMAVTIDIGEEKDVHPKNKQDVGHRLALQARARVYGEDVPHNSPSFASLTVEGERIRLRFTDTYGKLKTKDGAPPAGFAVAGADRRYAFAHATIDGETVVVWSEAVKKPIAARYAWANNPAGCNLYNAADLPAVPFRTDGWPAKTQDARGLVIDDMWK
jgi:sialate O-acetylesterase